MEKKKVNIGLDIGIASVGWSVVDTDFNIVEHGVRLFESMDDNGELNNMVRRTKRSMRRQVNRRKNLKLDFIKLLIRNNIFEQDIDKDKKYRDIFLEKYINDGVDILDERVKGLTHQLDKNNLIQVLYWYLSHRGYQYEIADDKEFEDAKKKFKNVDFSNTKLHPCQMQKEFVQKNGYLKSEFNRLFSTDRYLGELATILANDKNLPEKFKNDFTDLFQRRRSFEEGPGLKEGYYNNPKFKNANLNEVISPFSRHYNFDNKTGELKEALPNMWDKTIGKCSVFTDEERAPKDSASSQLFNLLNDLNNILIRKNERLTTQEKLDIIKLSFKTKSNFNQAKKYINEKYKLEKFETEVTGLRINTKKEQLLTELTAINEINKILGDKLAFTFEKTFNGSTFDFASLDKGIVDALSKSKAIEIRKESLAKLSLLKGQDEIIDNLAKKGGTFSATHSLSYKAFDLLIPQLIETNSNQMQLIHEYKLSKTAEVDLVKTQRKYIDSKWLDNLIASPTMKRALRQTINVLNDIIKKRDYKIDNLVIEMARDTNDKQAKESIKQLQKYNKESKELLSSYYLPEEKENFKGAWELKLFLFEQQKGHDAYTGEKLDKHKVLTIPSYTDIDHIIPYSQCFDDSRKNKVLTLSAVNSQKGNRQPFKFMSPEKFSDMKNKWWDWYGNGEGTKDRYAFYDMDKLKKLIDETDYSDPANSYGFINRNLVDTRYITKEAFRVMLEFIDQTSEDHAFHGAKVKPVNGRLTSFVRKQVDKKNLLKRPIEFGRDGSFDEKGNKIREWNGHHAEDATIVVFAALQNQKLNKFAEKLLSNPYYTDEQVAEWFKDKNEMSGWDKQLDIDKIREELNKKYQDVKFSYMLTKKSNVQLSNETLYKGKLFKTIDKKTGEVKKEFYKMDYINLLDEDKANKEKLDKMFNTDEYKGKIMMIQHDPKLFEQLREIFNRYKSEAVPFKKYCYDNDTNKFEVEVVEGKKQPKDLTIYKYVKLTTKNKDGEQVERKVSRIKYKGEPKVLDEVIKVTHSNNKDIDSKGNYSFYDSLNWVEIHIFKTIDKKGNEKNEIIPINATYIKKFTGKGFEYSEKYHNELKLIKANVRITETIKLTRGETIQDTENNVWRLVGCNPKQMKLEVKRVDGYNLRDRSYGLRTINTSLKGWKVIKTDYISYKTSIKFTF